VCVCVWGGRGGEGDCFGVCGGTLVYVKCLCMSVYVFVCAFVCVRVYQDSYDLRDMPSRRLIKELREVQRYLHKTPPPLYPHPFSVPLLPVYLMCPSCTTGTNARTSNFGSCSQFPVPMPSRTFIPSSSSRFFSTCRPVSVSSAPRNPCSLLGGQEPCACVRGDRPVPEKRRQPLCLDGLHHRYRPTHARPTTVVHTGMRCVLRCLGPPDTPFESGRFELRIQVPPTYPHTPPKVIPPECHHAALLLLTAGPDDNQTHRLRSSQNAATRTSIGRFALSPLPSFSWRLSHHYPPPPPPPPFYRRARFA
jgi:hypothetical protein